MATANEIRDIILTPMAVMFTAPKGSQNGESEVVRAYMSILKDYTAEDLERGWDYLVRNHKIRSWPLPAEIIKAIAETGKSDRPRLVYQDKDDLKIRAWWGEKAKDMPAYQKAMEQGLALPFIWVAEDERRQLDESDLFTARKRWDNMLSYRDRYRGKDNGIGDQIVRRNERLCRGEMV